jgi:hypothetical protein
MKFKLRRHTFTHYLFFISFLIGIISCRKDDNYLEGNTVIEFSQDTILFDTVFTTIGSATKIVKLFNKESSPILVDVSLGNEKTSVFRMNVNGFQGKDIKDVEIPAKDSIYIFVEVTVNPDEPLSISPFVIEDDILIKQNQNTQNIKLIAWGQNANYLSNKGEIRSLTCGNGSISFDDTKPYVIYGILIIDSCELIISAGRSIHIHGGVVVEPGLVYNDGQIIVFPDGKLTVNGTAENPVIFEGDRLDPDYSNIPGQWVGIRIWKESKDNTLSHVDIRNSIIGVLADSASSVEISNSIIQNTSSSNLIGIHADITVSNSLLHSPGLYNAQLTYGGNYLFDYTTMVNESNQREALYLNNYKCTDLENDPLCQSAVDIKPANISLRNCIVFGPSEDEINFDDYTNGEIEDVLNFDLSNCIVRVNEILGPDGYPNFFDDCKNCITYMDSDTLFRDMSLKDYRLDTMSIAENNAIAIPNITMDLLGYNRDPLTPDIGCYEFEN